MDIAHIEARKREDFPEFKELFDLVESFMGYLPNAYLLMAENHVNPKDALQIAIDLEAKKSIGMHWGTFILTDEAVTEPPQLLQSALKERDLPKDYFITLKPGDYELIEN